MFGFFCLSCLWFNIWESLCYTLHRLSKVSLPCPNYHCLCLRGHYCLASATARGTGIVGSSLKSMIPWVTSSSSLAGRGRGLGKCHGHEGASTVYDAVSFTGFTEGGWGVGNWSVDASVADGQGLRLLCCWAFTCGHGCHHCQEARVGYTAFPTTPGFFGSVSSAAIARGPGLQAPPQLFSCFYLSTYSSPPTFRCGEVWNCPGPGVGQMHLFCTVGVLLVVSWRGETKGVSHYVTMLTSLLP